MIIKKSKNDNKDNTNQPNTTTNQENQAEMSFSEKAPEPAMPIIRERQERRRGDRRRGYRRIDDRNLISRAHEEANAIRERSAVEGFEYGIIQAKEELKKLGYAMAEFLQAKEKAFEEVNSEIAYLAIKVAEKIIRTEVACDETIVLSIVSDVLKEIGKDETNIVIKTNPADSQIVRDNLPKVFPYGREGTKIIVIDDNDVEWGSCIVETNNGMIDARFSTQLKILQKAFEAGL